MDNLNPSGGALFAIQNVVPTRMKYKPRKLPTETAVAMH